MRRSWILVFVFASQGLLTQPADARPRDKDQRDSPRVERRSGDERGDSQAGLAAQRAVEANGGGRVLSVERDGGGFRVKVLKNGDVRTHFVSGE